MLALFEHPVCGGEVHPTSVRAPHAGPVSNDIEIVANGDTCLIYDQPLPEGGLKFSHVAS